ncbi:MAG: serpin family protein, partial [Psychrobacter sp.]|nr:serpin family protein [Psychrobacter sp.]
SRQTINQSIADQTNQMIPELLPKDSIKPTTVSVLTNAIYFKGDWQSPFDSSSDAEFYKLDGSKINTKLMYQKGYFGYSEDKQAQVIALPYKGEALSMLVILPKSKDKAAMDRLVKGLTPTQMDQWSSKLEKQEAIVRLPKFTLDAGYKMKPLLSNLGMPRAFEKTGEFKMFGNDLDRDLVIDEVYHKAVIKVDEVGSEAAAATGIVGIFTGGPVNLTPPVEFNADHPFMFVIKDNKTGAILFLGQVNEP